MRRSLILALLLAVGAGCGVAGYQHLRIQHGGWREIAWQLPRDGWPPGRAFRCESEACGGEVEVYVRPKLGFCSNCETGVVDDDEVDRVADVDMFSQRFVPLARGEATAIGDMRGRLRAYDLNLAGGRHYNAVGFAVSRNCDLMVAVAKGEGAADNVERAALDFLNSAKMTRWMSTALDGG